MRSHTTFIATALALALAGCSEDSARDEVTPEPAAATPAAAETPEPAAEPRAAQAPATATVGQPAPDFTLTDQAGTEHRLSQYRGKIVVLEWINPDCPYVQRHYQAQTMRRLVEELPGDRVVWLAIDSSHFVEPADSEAWRREHGLPYPILQDPEGRVGRTYAARTTPHMYVIDAQGVLRYAGAIDDDPRGRSDQPRSYVREAVRALLDGGDPPVSTSDPYGCSVKYES